MDDDSKSKLKDVLSAIDPQEFQWSDEPKTSGFTAQTMNDVLHSSMSGVDTISISNIGAQGADHYTIGGIDLSTISIDPATLGNVTLSSNGNGSASWSTGSTIIGSINTGLHVDYSDGKSYIKTEKHKIDLDELGEMMETLKKRLLILTPNFEMHEKYPMLKELYDEYKAMEKLLSGPDSSLEDM